MTIESATTFAGLDENNPATVSSQIQEGAGHFRLLKRLLKSLFPSILGPVTLSHTEINQLPGRIDTLASITPGITGTGSAKTLQAGGSRIINVLAATASTDAVTKAQMDAMTSTILNKAWPVGARYYTTFNISPGSSNLIGIGTWVNLGAGSDFVYTWVRSA